MALRSVRPVILKSLVELQICDRERLDRTPLARIQAVQISKPSTSATRSVISPTTAPVMSLGPPVVKLSGNMRCNSSPMAPPTKTTANTMAANVNDPIAAPNVSRAAIPRVGPKGRPNRRWSARPEAGLKDLLFLKAFRKQVPSTAPGCQSPALYFAPLGEVDSSQEGDSLAGSRARSTMKGPAPCDVCVAGNRGCGAGQSAERRRLRGYPAGRGLTAR
jgi:hypothetical protein